MKQLLLAALLGAASISLAQAQESAAWSEVVPNNHTGVSIRAGKTLATGVSGYAGEALCACLYDKATAPTCGTDTPVVRLCAPATGQFTPLPASTAFYSGLAVCVTKDATTCGTTNPTATTSSINVLYRALMQ